MLTNSIHSKSSLFVIDDEPNNLDVIDLLLSNENYRLSYFGDALTALEAMQSIVPDIFLLDVMMPGMDGIELCYRLKQNPHTKHIPIIMVSALNAKEDLARCLEAGADDFIGKPLNGLELRARIRSLLRIKRQYDDLQNLLRLREEALNLREDLSNMVIHDLRNPLANILLSCQILRLRDLDAPVEKKLDQIEYSSHRLETMIDSLLIMAKLESGKLLIRPTKINLHDLANAVLDDFQIMADQQRICLGLELPIDESSVDADAILLRRVLDNLLSNALKFAPSQSTITLVIQNQRDNITIQIKDQGYGVSPELREQIFSKFEIGNHLPQVQQMGLGLAFCKLAIEAHAGTIQVEDNHPKGCIFTINLNRSATEIVPRQAQLTA